VTGPYRTNSRPAIARVHVQWWRRLLCWLSGYGNGCMPRMRSYEPHNSTCHHCYQQCPRCVEWMLRVREWAPPPALPPPPKVRRRND
jgi:hypothetical protein